MLKKPGSFHEIHPLNHNQSPPFPLPFPEAPDNKVISFLSKSPSCSSLSLGPSESCVSRDNQTHITVIVFHIFSTPLMMSWINAVFSVSLLQLTFSHFLSLCGMFVASAFSAFNVQTLHISSVFFLHTLSLVYVGES